MLKESHVDTTLDSIGRVNYPDVCCMSLGAYGVRSDITALLRYTVRALEIIHEATVDVTSRHHALPSVPPPHTREAGCQLVALAQQIFCP